MFVKPLFFALAMDLSSGAQLIAPRCGSNCRQVTPASQSRSELAPVATVPLDNPLTFMPNKVVGIVFGACGCGVFGIALAEAELGPGSLLGVVAVTVPASPLFSTPTAPAVPTSMTAPTTPKVTTFRPRPADCSEVSIESNGWFPSD